MHYIYVNMRVFTHYTLHTYIYAQKYVCVCVGVRARVCMCVFVVKNLSL